LTIGRQKTYNWQIIFTLLLTLGASLVINATRHFRKLASSCDIHPIKLRRPDSHRAWFWGRRWGSRKPYILEPRSSSQRFSSRCPYSVQVAMVPFSIKPVAEKSRLNLYVVELYIYIYCIYYWWFCTWASQMLIIFLDFLTTYIDMEDDRGARGGIEISWYHRMMIRWWSFDDRWPHNIEKTKSLKTFSFVRIHFGQFVFRSWQVSGNVFRTRARESPNPTTRTQPNSTRTRQVAR